MLGSKSCVSGCVWESPEASMFATGTIIMLFLGKVWLADIPALKLLLLYCRSTCRSVHTNFKISTAYYARCIFCFHPPVFVSIFKLCQKSTWLRNVTGKIRCHRWGTEVGHSGKSMFCIVASSASMAEMIGNKFVLLKKEEKLSYWWKLKLIKSSREKLNE